MMSARDVAKLLEQASILRSLAGTFVDPTMKSELTKLADRCEKLAAPPPAQHETG